MVAGIRCNGRRRVKAVLHPGRRPWFEVSEGPTLADHASEFPGSQSPIGLVSTRGMWRG